jgi:chemotaxis protein CheY-P-specific phosphatase CheC
VPIKSNTSLLQNILKFGTFMEERQIIDKIVESAQQKIQNEISGLIGVPLSLEQAQNKIVATGDLLQQLSGSQILTSLEISGDSAGTGHLLITVKDAIRLGGTLIMLPKTELDERIENEAYDEETEDSYGEIGNIIAGIYTDLFEKMHQSPCRFQRGEQRLVTFPITGEESEQPIAETLFYQVASDITLDGEQLGALIMLFPAIPFGLAEDVENHENQTQSAEEKIEDKQQGVADGLSTGPDSTDIADNGVQTEPSNTIEPEASGISQLNDESPDVDVQTRKNDIDSLLEICRVSIQDEVGDVVGVDVTFSEMNNKVVSKEQFYLDELSGKQVAATLEVTGDFEGSCYLYLGLKHAIRIGCTLLMLPSIELEAAVSESTLNPDVQDAYDEITTVISRVYTDVFVEHSGKTLKFIKRDIDQVVPMKVDIESDEPLINQTYYLNSAKIGLNSMECGHLQILFPTEMLGLEALQPEETAQFSEGQNDNIQTPLSSGNDSAQDLVSKTVQGAVTLENVTGKVLIISDSDPESERINQILDAQGIAAVQLNFRDNVNDYLPGAFQAVLLVMSAVDEQSLGMAIKISTSCSLPLIAIGYSWTRSKVFKAIKYGVSDIILAPATEEDVSRKITDHISSLAA